MRSDAPALLPILRSRHLAEILTVLLLHPDVEYTLSELAATSIGRSRANDIRVDDVSISGQHCRVRPEDGQFVLHDLKSTNGTLVNEKKVVRHVLAEGDVISIGETSLQFRREMKRE